MPIDVRTSGFSLAYSLATAIFGGFTPAISTYFIHPGESSRSRAVVTFAAACGLVAALLPDLRTPLLKGRWHPENAIIASNAEQSARNVPGRFLNVASDAALESS